MMRLDFKSIETSPNSAGTLGTMGTASVHANFAVPAAGKKMGTTGDTGKRDGNLSPMSPLYPQSLGTRKPSIDAVVPNVPTVPTKKQSSELETRSESIQRALESFRLDLVEEAIAAGHPAQELHRVNNMAWEFMRADGMSFEEAIRVAAAIVATCPPAPCEANYVDVWTLWLASARN